MIHTRMIRTTTFLRAVGAALTLSTMILANIGCEAEVVGPGPGYPVDGYDDYPPDAYIATTEPVYYEGHASYWYGGRWYYREGGRWGHYDREPEGLRGRRLQAPPVRRSYEHVARPARGGGRGGRGGGRR